MLQFLPRIFRGIPLDPRHIKRGVLPPVLHRQFSHQRTLYLVLKLLWTASTGTVPLLIVLRAFTVPVRTQMTVVYGSARSSALKVSWNQPKMAHPFLHEALTHDR